MAKKIVGFEKTIDIHNATQWKNKVSNLNWYGYKRQKGTRTWVLEGEGFRYVIHLMKMY